MRVQKRRISPHRRLKNIKKFLTLPKKEVIISYIRKPKGRP